MLLSKVRPITGTSLALFDTFICKLDKDNETLPEVRTFKSAITFTCLELYSPNANIYAGLLRVSLLVIILLNTRDIYVVSFYSFI